VSAQPDAIIHIEPIGTTIAVRATETVMQAARRAGLRWPTTCNGLAQCGVCHMKVLAASEAPAPPTPKEQAGLKLVPSHLQGPDVRLACQMKAKGEMTVRRPGVAWAKPKAE
jgi:2Fe-2S ferredoxin